MMKNVLRILSFMVSLSVILFITSCGDDEGDPVTPTDPTDSTNPTITVNAPADGDFVVAGSQVVSNIAFGDDTEISSVNITVGNGTVTVIDETVSDIADDSFTFSDNLAIPANVVLGEHTVTVTVTDAAGNSASATLMLEAVPALTSGKTTVIVTSVPDQIADYSNETIYMVGTIQESDWTVDNGSDPLTVYTDSEGVDSYYHQVDAVASEFKFVRGLSWDFGQKDADGKESSNNSIAEGDEVLKFDIGSWKDYNPDVTNGAGATVFTESGSPLESEIALQVSVAIAPATQSAVSTVSYALLDAEENELSSGDLTAGEGNYTGTLDISSLTDGNYTIKYTAVDAAGNMGREDQSLILVEFPCDDTGLDAVASDMTRIVISVESTTDDIYVTGQIGGVGLWGYSANGGSVGDAAYQLTMMSDGCYYIDLALLNGDILQFVRNNESFGDWWHGQAIKEAANSDATANFNVAEDSNGSTEKVVYTNWRADFIN